MGIIGHKWAKILSIKPKVVESQDKAYKMYFDERNNFAEDDFPVIPLVFKIIDIIELIGS